MLNKYNEGDEFYGKIEKTEYIVIEVLMDGSGYYYMIAPNPEFHVYREFEHRYVPMRYREETIDRLIMMNDWIKFEKDAE